MSEPVKLLTVEEVAELLRCGVKKLRRGWGPKPLRASGRRLLYHPSDVYEWQNACRPTSSARNLEGLGGSASSSAETSTEEALRRQIEERLNERLAKGARRSKRIHLAPTRNGAA